MLNGMAASADYSFPLTGEAVLSQKKMIAALLASAVLINGCAMTPMGPTVAVLPAPNKPFEAFQQDQLVCKQFAQTQVQGQADAANEKAAGAAALGIILGAGLGAAIGGGRGAGIGAASGSILGGGVGAESSQMQQMGIQQQYNNAFVQCMYSKGNQVPGAQVAAAPPPPPPPMAPPPAPIVAPAPTSSGGFDRGMVLEIQTELKRLGLLDSVDGDFGPKTRAAIMNFQQVKELTADGVPSPALLSKLKATT